MRFALDTNILIYFLEGSDPDVQSILEDAIFAPVARGEATAVVATLSIAELLVPLFRSGAVDDARQVRRDLEDALGIECVPLDGAVAELAAQIRGAARLRLPDAIVVASAIAAEADALVTNDQSLAAVALPIPIVRPAELRAQDPRADR